MDVVQGNTLLPGDPRLIDHIVCELKSQGIFDQFRKECISDVDTKPAYQNLRQRVEGSVTGFLKTQTWKPDMNKNQLREALRKNIYESGFLETGVERIVDQVVNPKINSVFLPQVEDVVYKFLGLEKPNRNTPYKNINGPLTINTLDLLPTDLDPISPDNEILDKTLNKSNETNLDDSKVDDFESPPFEPITDQNVYMQVDESSNDSKISGISGLTSHDSNLSDKELKVGAPDVTNPDSQLSKVSSNSRLSIITTDSKHNSEKMDISDESKSSNKDEGFSSFIFENKIPVTENGFLSIQQEIKDELEAIRLEINGECTKQNEEKPDEIAEKLENMMEVQVQTKDETQIEDSKPVEPVPEEETKLEPEKQIEPEKPEIEKEEKDLPETEPPKKEEKIDEPSTTDTQQKKPEKTERNRHDSERKRDKDKKSDRDRKYSSSTKSSSSSTSKDKDKNRDKSKDNRSKDKDKESSSSSSKSKEDKEKESSKNKDDKAKTSDSKDSSKESSKTKDKEDKSRSSSSKHSSRDRSRTDSKSDSRSSKDHKKDSKKSDDSRSRSEDSRSKTEKPDETKNRKSDSKSSKSDDKSSSRSRSESSSKNSSRDRKSSSSRDHKDKKDSKDSKKSNKRDKDDHSSSREKKDIRRSADRDSNDGSSGVGNTTSVLSKDNNSSNSSKSKTSDSSDSNSGSNSGDSGQSDTQSCQPIPEDQIPLDATSQTQKTPDKIQTELVLHPKKEENIDLPPTEVKIKKPRFASNIFEARKLMKVRKKLEKMEKKRQKKLEIALGRQNLDSPSIELDSIEDTDSMDSGKLQIVETDEVETKADDNKKEEDQKSSAVISKESWDAIEAQLSQSVNQNVDFNSYGDDNNDSSSSMKNEDGKTKTKRFSEDEDCLYFNNQVSPTTERFLKSVESYQKTSTLPEENKMAPPNSERPTKRPRKANLKYNQHVDDSEVVHTNNKKINDTKTTGTKRKQVKGKKRKMEGESNEIYSENNNKKLNNSFNVVDIAEEFDEAMNPSPSASNTSNGSVDTTTKKTNTRGKKNKKNNSVGTNADSFPLPLSPESDIAIEVKNKMADDKDHAVPVKTTRASASKNQRYSSDDLYKPRPFVSGSSRRQRGMLADKK